MNERSIIARQYGLITADQAVRSGWTRDELDGRLRRHELIRVGRNVYRSATHEVTDRQRALGAVLVAGADALLSVDSTLALWSVPTWRMDEIHVAVPHDQHPRVPGVHVHRVRDLAPVDRATLHRIPTTAPARTLIDIAATADVVRVEDAVDELLCRGALSIGHLVRRAEALSKRGRAGPATLLDVLAAWAQDEKRSTQREMRVLRDITARGLPAPVRQYEVRTPSGIFIARPDLAYPPPARIALEFQSFRWHATRRAWERDQERLAALVAAGWTVYPVVQSSLRDRCRALCAWLARELPLRAAA